MKHLENISINVLILLELKKSKEGYISKKRRSNFIKLKLKADEDSCFKLREQFNKISAFQYG